MNIEMRPVKNPQYGDVATSVAVFYIAGKGVHARHSAHELIRWDFTGTQWEGREIGGLRFSALDGMLSDPPPPPRETHNVQIGQTVTVDGVDYVITALPLDDPILMPVSRTAATAPS